MQVGQMMGGYNLTYWTLRGGVWKEPPGIHGQQEDGSMGCACWVILLLQHNIHCWCGVYVSALDILAPKSLWNNTDAWYLERGCLKTSHSVEI
jgi:hypothetical protein